MCETICRKKNEPSVTVYHPFLLLHDRLGVVTVAYRAWSICAGARTPWNAFPSATGGERYPWVVMTNSESSLTDREDENDLWPPCFQVYQPLRVHDGRSTVAGITCLSNAVWKLFRKKKSQNICILRCCRTFYSSLSLQIYDLLEGNSEWLWLFIRPKAPPALQSLIRCFLCPAHSDKVNYSSAFHHSHIHISNQSHIEWTSL